MNIHLYALLKNNWMYIVNREEMITMLNSQDLTSAVKTIVNKPIGALLYDVVSKNIFNMSEVDSKLISFNNERVSRIYSKLSSREKNIVDKLDALFDITNLYFMVISLNSGRKPSLIYPIGKLTLIDLSHVDSVDYLKKALPIHLSKYIDLMLSINVADLSNLLTMYSKFKPVTEDMLVNRVLAFHRDAILIKTCLLLKQLPATGVSLLTMYISDFENICSVRDLRTLPQILHNINPLYSGFSEILSDLFSIKEVFELIDLGAVLYSVYLSSDLINTLERVVVRTYLLFLSETMLIRTILTLVDSKLYIDRFRDVVSKWWVV